MGQIMEKLCGMLERQELAEKQVAVPLGSGEHSSSSQLLPRDTGKAPRVIPDSSSPEPPVIPIDERHETIVDDPQHASIITGNELTLKKLEMPIFEGTNVAGWVVRAERYFKYGAIRDQDKLPIATLSIDGEALNWYDWQNDEDPFVDWKDFKSQLLERFADQLAGKVSARLLSLT
ncbi:PREDICTED: uncharacterized protein LOC104801707 [Tarenaya hassleriana]|uniref:uncharacterized protein LOC104801707 n=1 Tax=Tarenaya hassleriana TaxID=28532 RepID=UPI00053CA017|nr:PREDICTED: uncharacterized protein LOC104801707 [Tarenaya hassleriana]